MKPSLPLRECLRWICISMHRQARGTASPFSAADLADLKLDFGPSGSEPQSLAFSGLTPRDTALVLRDSLQELRYLCKKLRCLSSA